MEAPEKNIPMYHAFFSSIHREHETMCFQMRAPATLSDFSALLVTELAIRVVNPDDWVLVKLDRIIFCDPTKNPLQAFTDFMTGGKEDA